MTVGVLALQGDFAEHLSVLASLAVPARDVRTTDDLDQVTHLILPGGESTVLSSLLDSTGLRHAILARVRSGSLPIFGTCAGAILLARKVRGPHAPVPLALLDIVVDRNAYGPQSHSFRASVRVPSLRRSLDASFIRAPKITHVGKGVTVLAKHRNHPVVVAQGDVLAATFHTETAGIADLHRLFLDL